MRFSSSDSPVVLAHRGDTFLARENSVDAIRAARVLGAAGVEVDVRMTLDGHLVLAHDPDVAGMPIDNSELHSLRAKGELDLLAEGLVEAHGLMLDLEIKGPVQDPRGLIEALGETISRGSARRVLITSFWVQILLEAQVAIPDISIGILTSAAFDEDGSEALRVASQSGFGCILPSSASVSKDLIDQAHSAGISVIAWTENDVERFKTLHRWGIDGVISDRPRDLLGQI